MSDKVLLYVIIGAFLLAIGIGIFTGWYIKPDKQCPVIKDTILVKGDTIPVPYPVTVIKWKEKQVAVYDTSQREYEGYFDSLFINNKDTIEISTAVVFAEKTKEFEVDMDIQHKDYDYIQIDTLKINNEIVKEVGVDNPLWIWTTVVGGILLILSIVFGG